MKSTIVIGPSGRSYALGAYWGPAGLDAILLAEVGRHKHTPTTGLRVSDLDVLTFEPQLCGVGAEDFTSRAIIGPWIEPQEMTNLWTGEPYIHSLGRQICYPSVAIEDAEMIITAVRSFAAGATSGVGADGWADLVGGAAIPLNR